MLGTHERRAPALIGGVHQVLGHVRDRTPRAALPGRVGGRLDNHLAQHAPATVVGLAACDQETCERGGGRVSGEAPPSPARAWRCPRASETRRPRSTALVRATVVSALRSSSYNAHAPVSALEALIAARIRSAIARPVKPISSCRRAGAPCVTK